MYSKHLVTPQTEPARDDQVQNSAGGYVFPVDEWQQLDRFLILGTVGGTYYVNERKMTLDNAKNILNLIEKDGRRVVDRVVEISDAGRAVRNTPALFVLALCAAYGDTPTRSYAMSRLSDVARTSTHLFGFLNEIQPMRGWGRALKEGVAGWYLSAPVDKLAYQAVKYRQRDGWTHRDVLRKAHPVPLTSEQNALFHWITQGEVDEVLLEIPVIKGYLLAQEATTAAEVAKIITEYRLPREAVPTEFLNSKEVWTALLMGMPITALIRNLGNMSKVGLLVPGAWDIIEYVTARLTNQEQLKRGRVHPISILAALRTYGHGRGMLGHGEWKVVPDVVDALDDALYMAFDAVEPTNKRYLLGLDVSGSMNQDVSGINNLSCMHGALIMSMITNHVEPMTSIMAFDHGIRDIHVSKKDRLDTAMNRLPRNYGGTDCALPMIHALNNGMEVDVFCIYTDSETWAGKIHPFKALQEYRKQTGIPAKLVVIGMTSTGFSIADPHDPGMLDVVGFDTQTPAAIAEFAKLDFSV